MLSQLLSDTKLCGSRSYIKPLFYDSQIVGNNSFFPDDVIVVDVGTNHVQLLHLQ